MIAILINCITLGSYQPCHDVHCETKKCQWIRYSDHLLFLFFLCEMIIKMIAMGVYKAPNSYLADYWNRLDCFIVIAGALEYILDTGNVNLAAIRTVRVLRPLRAINRIPSMRILVTLLLDTLPMLGNVLLLCFFVFFIFGIIGVQLWSGLLRQRCFIQLPPNFTQPSYVPSYYRMPYSDKEYLCSTTEHNGLHRCQDLPPLRSADMVSICQNGLPDDWRPPTLLRAAGPNGVNFSGSPFEDRFLDGELVPYDLVPGDEASPFLVKQMSPLIAQSIAQPAYAPQEPLSMINSVSSLNKNHQHHHRPRRSKSPDGEASSRTGNGYEPETTTTAHLINDPYSDDYYNDDDDGESPYDAMPLNRPRRRREKRENLNDLHKTMANSKSQQITNTQQLQKQIIIETNSNSDQFNREMVGTTNNCQRVAGPGNSSRIKCNPNTTLQQRHRAGGAGSRLATTANHQNRRKKGACINWNKYYTECRAGGPNPFQGTISFDNVGMAWTTIFLVISLEGWSDIMYLLQDSHSFWVWVYFVLLIVIGSFFMINLCLVVIATQFSATKKREMERMRQERLKFSSSSTLTGNANEPTNCYTVIVKLIARFLRRSRMSIVRYFKIKKCHRINAKRVAERRKYINSHQMGAGSASGSASTAGPSSHNIMIESHQKQDQQQSCSVSGEQTNQRPHRRRSCCPTSASKSNKNKHETSQGDQDHGPMRNMMVGAGGNGDDYPESSTNRNSAVVIPSSFVVDKSSLVLATGSSAAAPANLHNTSTGTGNDNNQLTGDLFDKAASRRHSWKQQSVKSRVLKLRDSKPDQEMAGHEDATSGNDSSCCHRAAKCQLFDGLSVNHEQLEQDDQDDDDQVVYMINDDGTRHDNKDIDLTRNEHATPTIDPNQAKEVVAVKKRTKMMILKGDQELDPSREQQRRYRRNDRRRRQNTQEEEDLECQLDEVDINCLPNCITKNDKLRQAKTKFDQSLKNLVDHRYFQRLILLAILINAISMGIEYHNQPNELTEAVEISNSVFACLFAIEMILKLWAHGLYNYLIDGFNCFDGCIVILSMLELFESSGSGQSGLSVLRTFRLLRILKLVRFMPALQRQLVIMLRTLDNVAVFFALLVLFIFIFSILGMNLFGCKFCEILPDGTERCDRKNFNSLLWSLVTVFQILTQEDWNIVLFNGMEKTSHWAALYFVLLMTFGNYVLFNLLVAILVEGFSQEDEPKAIASPASSLVDQSHYCNPGAGGFHLPNQLPPPGPPVSPCPLAANNGFTINGRLVLMPPPPPSSPQPPSPSSQAMVLYHNDGNGNQNQNENDNYDDDETRRRRPIESRTTYRNQDYVVINRSGMDINCQHQFRMVNNDNSDNGNKKHHDHIIENKLRSYKSSCECCDCCSASSHKPKTSAKNQPPDSERTAPAEQETTIKPISDRHAQAFRSDLDDQDESCCCSSAPPTSSRKKLASSAGGMVNQLTTTTICQQHDSGNGSLSREISRDESNSGPSPAAVGSLMPRSLSLTKANLANVINTQQDLAVVVVVDREQKDIDKKDYDDDDQLNQRQGGATCSNKRNHANALPPPDSNSSPSSSSAKSIELNNEVNRAQREAAKKHLATTDNRDDEYDAIELSSPSTADCNVVKLIGGPKSSNVVVGYPQPQEPARSTKSKNHNGNQNQHQHFYHQKQQQQQMLSLDHIMRLPAHSEKGLMEKSDANGNNNNINKTFYNYGQSLTTGRHSTTPSSTTALDNNRQQQELAVPLFYSDYAKSCSSNGGAIGAADNHLQQITGYAPPIQQSAVSSNFLNLAAGVRSAPKRLVYFYDFLSDDIEDEIDFLTRSLESKSYATSVHAQTDPYLDSVARSTTTLPCPFANTPAGQAYERYKTNLLACFSKPITRASGCSSLTSSPQRTNRHHRKHQPAGSDSFFDSKQPTGQWNEATNENDFDRSLLENDSPSPPPIAHQMLSADQASEHVHNVALKRMSPFRKSRDSSSILSTSDNNPLILDGLGNQQANNNNILEYYFTGGSNQINSQNRKEQAQRMANPTRVGSSRSAHGLLKSIGPFWSSVPDYLNRTSVALMRLHEASRANNMLLGRRERSLIRDRGHFDPGACRWSRSAYERALNMFANYFANLALFNPEQHQHSPVYCKRTSLESSSQVQSQQRRLSHSTTLGTSNEDNLAEATMSAITGPFDAFRIGPVGSPSTVGSATNTRHLSISGSQSNKPSAADRGRTQSNKKNSKPSTNNCDRSIKWQPIDRNQKALQFQRELMISLQKFAMAMHNYRERRLLRQRDEAILATAASQTTTASNNLLSSRQTALRRGSVILLSKLKLFNDQQQTSGQQPQTPVDGGGGVLPAHMRATGQHHSSKLQDSLFNYQSVPRLSLTRAESSVCGDSVSPTSDQQRQEQQNSSSDIVIGMGGSTNTDLGIQMNIGTPAQKSTLSGRHSISNFTSAVQQQTQKQQLSSIDVGRTTSEVCIEQHQPLSPTDMNARHKIPPASREGPTKIIRAGSIMNWLGSGSKESDPGFLRRRSSGQQTSSSIYHGAKQQRHSSCFSQASAATSGALSQEDSGGINSSFPAVGSCAYSDALALAKLRSNWRRRRSFSGPFEWFWHETHAPGQNLMIEPETKSKRGGGKKRAKRIKAQRSNSSDYHSLNNRRVYRLDSRGFQTKLRGTFYVITHDPLIANNNHQSRQRIQQQQPVVGCSLDRADNNTNYDQQQNQQQPTTTTIAVYSKPTGEELAIESAINSSAEENYNNNHVVVSTSCQRIGGADCASATSCGSGPGNTPSLATTTTTTINQAHQHHGHHHHRHGGQANKDSNKPMTFLIYFRWTKWMLKRRHYSLFIFSPKSRIRRFCNTIIKRREFDYFVLFFISMNCVTLAMERPIIPPNSKEREFLIVANYYFTFLFTLEMAFKVIAKGLYYGHGAYLTDNWNIMDGVLVGFSLFDLLLSIVAERSPRIFAILRVFRLLRSLRPLRVINRLMGLKLVVQTLLLSLRPIGNIVLICCTFFIIFGILGVQLFKGTFFYCDGPDPLEIMRTVDTREDCLMDHRNRWVNRKYNFDNLGQALMALFVLSSKDGWVNIMYTGLDAVGVDINPRENYNEWRLLYFISFLLLVAFFVLNMFVGVVVENFHRCRKEQELEEKARRAEKRQRKLDKRRRKLREPPYYSNYGPVRAMLHRWVTGGYFDLLIAAIIGFNVIFMSLEHYQMAPELINLLKVSNYIFTVAFILEAIIKTTALGMRRYLKDRWNQLDVMIVAMSIVGIVFEELESFTFPINPTLLRVLRVMRIARVLKLLKMAKGIRALLDTVMQALPQVGNLGLLFFLLFFIFAALGVELFGRLECSEEYPCSGLMDQHAHFQNFGLAFLTLFRVATGDNWNGIMKDTLRDKCDPSSNCLRNCCVSQIIAPLYFVVFVLLAQFVLVNVVVAVLMKHLEESHHEMEIDEEYELDKQLAEELAAKKRALLEAKERQTLYWC